MDKAIETSEAELERIVKDKWTNSFRPSYITAKGCMLPCYYPEFQKVIDDFEVFDSDIWICSFPRTGTTWTSEMAWLIANNCNYEKAKISMFDRIRFLEFKLERKNQRNPLDTCVSYYYHAASIMFSGSLEEYCKLFLCDKGKSVPDEEIRILQDHLSFESMKKNPAVSGGKALDFVKETGPKKSAFVRSGKVGGYKTEMPQHFIEIFESWMKSNLEGTGLHF
ncbi:Sulfotransfer 1 domain containing protein [Asbolus verrucosus]|uniref:Sulfotransfer 1 domain containing protein n=1 Tax=Asbolus verrucosus TaxID=1661398 RepID=A0A482VBK4_ASBVE|nr:Sulfotransfer 1 domain containing protein [Asbolus verrucosus]